ncbi:hypothetical protein [Halochromatium roseum]|nr:hypothetical protein [Halochromatium roseum]
MAAIPADLGLLSTERIPVATGSPPLPRITATPPQQPVMQGANTS